MIVLEPGASYALQTPNGECVGVLQFSRNVRHDDGRLQRVIGTTTEDVIAVLLHRLATLQAKLPCPENDEAVWHLMRAQSILESRTADRQQRGVEGTDEA